MSASVVLCCHKLGQHTSSRTQRIALQPPPHWRQLACLGRNQYQLVAVHLSESASLEGQFGISIYLNPHNIGKVVPCPVVFDWFISTILPQEWTVFLKKTFKRTTTRPSVQPNQNFISGVDVFRGEEPEVKLAGVLCTGDWHKTGITLS